MDEDMGDEDVECVLVLYVESMVKVFEFFNLKYVFELEMFEVENVWLFKEIEDLEKFMLDLVVLDDYFKIMEEDKIKFEEYNMFVL